MMVTIEKTAAFYIVKANSVTLGEVYLEIDGFWVFSPVVDGAAWEAYVLREIADQLDALNKDWRQPEFKK